MAATPFVLWVPTIARFAIRTWRPGASSIRLIRASLRLVAGVIRPDVVQEPPVDLVDDLQLPREEGLEQLDRPLLQGLRQQRVVGVRQGADREVPRLVPAELGPVEQDAHQFGHGHRRVGVVELDGDLVRQRRPVVPAAEEPGDDVGQRAGDEEVLLDEPQRAPAGRRVVRVQDAADRLGEDPVRHRAEEVAAAELAEVEDVRGRGLPQAEGVDRPPAVTDHRPVVGHPEQVRRPARDAPRSAPRATSNREPSGTDTVSFGRATSHGSGRASQWSGCSTWEPSRISWRKIP